ncbi:MAG: EscN/YscN/HrcN family type III secretion system ATPase, partial [Phycisphaerae bacterium]
MRIKAVLTAVSIAEDFRDQGNHVLFFLDSLTRLAMAQRELGLLLGEPPGARGYPPSVQSLLAEVLERLGCGDVGAITGLITVLVEGDDLDEPITDAARSILDGHIVLDRKLASQGHFPAIDVLGSVSRLFREVTSPQQQADAVRLRNMMVTYAEVSDLIQIGAYKPGASQQVDRAVQLMPAVRHFLQQTVDERSAMSLTQQQLEILGKAWP